MRVREGVFERRGDSRDLIVLIHGFAASPSSFDGVRTAIGELPDLAHADLFAPELPFGILSTARPHEVVASIIVAIDNLWHDRNQHGDAYRRIYLVGHSMGGLFVRKVYVCASGSHPNAPIESAFDDAVTELNAGSCQKARPWAPHVERIILIAALNRGWSISQHLGLKNAALWSLGSFIGRLLTVFKGERPLVFAVRKGSPFVTQLRIQWIRMRQRAGPETSPPSGAGGAVTVQLLGSIDDMVSPDDSVDIVSGGDFYYLDVPYSSHVTVLDMSGDDPDLTVRRRQAERKACFTTAIADSAQKLEARTIRPVDDEMQRRDDVTDVVFVIHGIRDFGYWTQKIARRAIDMGRNRQPKRLVVAETSTYGYFPMLPFIWPPTRRKKVEWLMDEYAEAVARYPHARIAYMGHSNGTYLLARSLVDYPVVRFTNVVFAGSVVTTDYDWRRHILEGRVRAVLNYTATADAVVAFFPKLFQKPRWQDLGSAGHDGFDQDGDGIHQLGPVRGSHSAARQEAEWDTIAKFLLDGFGPEIVTVNAAPRRNRFVEFFGRIPIVVWLGIIVPVLLGGALIWQIPSEGARVLAMVAYAAVVFRVLTRV